MMDRDNALVEEAIAVNHKNVGKKSLDEYNVDLVHWVEYLHSKFATDLLSAEKKHVKAFMLHLEGEGGRSPAPSRVGCKWCERKCFPVGRDGEPLSASRRKKYLSALRFFYWHAMEEDNLPSVDPTYRIPSPTVHVKRQYTPSKKDVKRFLNAESESLRETLLAHWIYYAPSRRETFREARWIDIEGIDTDDCYWHIPKGKGGKSDGFPVPPKLRNLLRRWRDAQREEAKTNPRIANALADDKTAHVLLSRNGLPLHPNTINKIVKARAIRAGVGTISKNTTESVNGKSSKVHPHCLRRAWADHALNDKRSPATIDEVSEALGHSDITTTRRHYAHTKPDRARKALLVDRLAD
jgi:integrase